MRKLLPPRLCTRSPNAFGAHNSARVAQNGAKSEALRHHADDRVRGSVKKDGLATMLRSPAKASQPQVVAENDFEFGANAVFALDEQSSEQRLSRPAWAAEFCVTLQAQHRSGVSTPSDFADQ
jgi:chromosome condensin MukBEF MukE localization factor